MTTDSSRFCPLFDEDAYREMFEQLNDTYMSVMDELTASVYPKGVIKLKMTLSHDVELDQIVVGWECSGDVPKKKRTAMTEYNAKIQELEDRLSAAEEELRALKAGDNKDDVLDPPHPRWRPAFGEEYYLINRDASISSFCWDGGKIDAGIFAASNVYKSIDAVEYAVERWKVLAEMREWAGKWNDPYRIIYNDGKVEPDTVFVGRCISYGEIRFATEADAKNCIKAVGEDRLKKYYFGIPEDRGCCTSER